MHHFRVAYILHFLEILSCVLNHELEAPLVLLFVFFVDQVVHATCDSSSLILGEHEHLRDLGPVTIVAEMCLINGENRHEFARRFLVDQEVVPKWARFDNDCTLNEEGQ